MKDEQTGPREPDPGSVPVRSRINAMRSAVLAGLVVLAIAASAQAQPTLNFSVSQIYHGEIVQVRGTGFTPNGALLSRMIRPDASVYPEMQMKADAKGELSHAITIVPDYFGSYEVIIEDVVTKTSATQRFLMVPPTFDKAVPTQQATMPTVFAGVWQGTVSGERPVSSPAVDAAVTLVGGRVGSVIGTVAYPADRCGGELWLVSASADRIQLGEIIRYGRDKCNGRALIDLTRGKDASMAMLWRDVTGAGAARGTVSKRSE
jgi:hypothetical protein